MSEPLTLRVIQSWVQAVHDEFAEGEDLRNRAADIGRRLHALRSEPDHQLGIDAIPLATRNTLRSLYELFSSGRGCIDDFGANAGTANDLLNTINEVFKHRFAAHDAEIAARHERWVQANRTSGAHFDI